jgi:hypothetical protein
MKFEADASALLGANRANIAILCLRSSAAFSSRLVHHLVNIDPEEIPTDSQDYPGEMPSKIPTSHIRVSGFLRDLGV